MFSRDSLEMRIIELVADNYPITVDEIAKNLKVSRQRIERALKKLVAQQWVSLDILPDKTYVRLLKIPMKGGKKTDGEPPDDISYA
jgi:DNA-binding MarR family transcriptional regulator